MGYFLGIDIGTTYTAAAVWRDGRYDIASLGNRAPTIPSVVLLRDDAQVLTGEAAVRRAATEPGRVAREFKRRVGDPTPIIVGGTPYSADALMAKLLRWVVDQVTEVEGGPPAGIAVSHPANWGNYKLDLLRQAISLADLDGVATLTEPEAAAIHYASQARVEPGSIIAVYDLGGGTFDAAVLRKTGDGWQILGAPEGIERLGGVDFDQAVFHHVAQAIGGAIDELDPDDPTAQAAVARLRQECIDAKEALSSDSDVSIPVILPNLQTEVRLTRAEYEGMIRPALTDSITALNRALRSAQVTPEQVTAVLLVGGSSRTPLVAELVSSALGRPVAVDAHPKYGVATGAAITAAALAGQVEGAAGSAGTSGAGAGAGAAAAGRGDAPGGGAAGGVHGAADAAGAAGAGAAGAVGAAGVAGAAAGFLAGRARAGDAGHGAPDASPGRTETPFAPSPGRGGAPDASPGGPETPLAPSAQRDGAGRPPGAGPDPAATTAQPATARHDAEPSAGGRRPSTPGEPTRPVAAGTGAPGRRDPRSVTVPYTGERAPGAYGDGPAGGRRSPAGEPGRTVPRQHAVGSGAGAGGRGIDEVGGSGGRGGSGGAGARRPLLVAVGAIMALALVGGVVAMALSGDDDPGSGAAGASGESPGDDPGTTAPPTDSTAPPATDPPPTGPFVQISDVQLEGGQYRVNYQVIGYTPEIGGEGTLHIHFFPDTQPPNEAGTNGPDSADWHVTDEASSALTKYTPDTVAGATQMCAAVADHNHAVHTPEVRTGNCVDLPA